jgi:hypothetical protein
MDIESFKQGTIVIGVAVIGIIAASYQNWAVVGSILTGAFAILQNNKPRQA